MGYGTLPFLIIVFSIVGCAVRQVTPQQVAGRTLGGAAVGAAAGTVAAATAGAPPAAGAAGGAAAGGLLGFLSGVIKNLFVFNVYDYNAAPYNRGYHAPHYGGRTYDPEEACSSLENSTEREWCEEEYRKEAEEQRQRAARQIERDACRMAHERVRYTGTVPEEYCDDVYAEAWQQARCKEGMARCSPKAYKQREQDIRRLGREAGRGPR